MKLSEQFETALCENSAQFAVIRSRRLSDKMRAIVGSPIELQFICALTELIIGMEASYRVVTSDEEERSSPDFFIWPQKQIGRHRVDFVIGRASAPAIVVECDGRDFHHATRDQIERDRTRDAELASDGWKVFRYPGTQINNSPWKVALEVVGEVDANFFAEWWMANLRFSQ